MVVLIREKSGKIISTGDLRKAIQQELDNRHDLKDLKRVRRLTEFKAEIDYFQSVFQEVLALIDILPPNQELPKLLARLYVDPYCYALLPGVVDTLRAYCEEKVPVALLSNSSPMTRELLGITGLGKYFSVVVLSHEVGHVKPEPYIYKYVLQQLKIPAESTLYVDDRWHFVRGACFVGMKGVHLLRDRKTDPRQEVKSSTSSLKYYTIDAIPQVRQLTEAFSTSQVRESINPSEEVASRILFQKYYV